MNEQERRALQLFASVHQIRLSEVHRFNNLAQHFADCSTHECNGDRYPGRSTTDKNACAELWGQRCDRVSHLMVALVDRWGFAGLDFGVGFFPTILNGQQQRLRFPYTQEADDV